MIAPPASTRVDALVTGQACCSSPFVLGSPVGCPSTPSASRPDARIEAFDALRAFAVTAVVLSHSLPEGPWLNALNPGRVGVKLFFALSGFLITGILLRERAVSESHGRSPLHVLRPFFIRRALRLLPLSYGVLLLLVLIAPAERYASLPWHFGYVGNMYNAAQGSWPGPASHFWSLAVEEQFYLLWPFVMLLVPHRRLNAVIATGIVVGPLSRILLLRLTGSEVSAYVPFTSCFDSLAAGALLASWTRPGGPLRSAPRWSGSAIAVIGATAYGLLVLYAYRTGVRPPDFVWADFACSVLAFGVLLALTASGSPGRPAWAWRSITYVGVISYGIYVWHYPLIWVADQIAAATPGALPPRGWAWFALSMAASTALAAASWHAFERPIQRFKERWPYTLQASRASAADAIT
jgi:peptidoglycan/LPS O-acetylase OafA/YrhL